MPDCSAISVRATRLVKLVLTDFRYCEAGRWVYQKGGQIGAPLSYRRRYVDVNLRPGALLIDDAAF